MRFNLPSQPIDLAEYLPEFMELFRTERWVKRANQLADESERSPLIRRIVFDYHWLEMTICHQWQVFTNENCVDLSANRELSLASLNFAATAVEVHRRLSDRGRRVFSGRVFDALKAENGFAALYLEVSLVQRLLTYGFDVELPDMEGTGQFDILFSQDDFTGEIECKSQSADAGRQVHRKHFYRFAAALQFDKELERSICRVLILATLSGRLSPDLAQQALLKDAIKALFASDHESHAEGFSFNISKYRIDEISNVEENLHDPELLKLALNKAFGHNLHIACWRSSKGALVLVMRSSKEDDTSFPLLEAMRKGASQLSKTRPGFLAVQEHGLKPEELLGPNVQRRACILSGTLFDHYKARHVNAVYVTGYAALLQEQNRLLTPSFAVINMRAKPFVQEKYALALTNAIVKDGLFEASVAP